MEEITQPSKVIVTAPETDASLQITAISIVAQNTIELTCKDAEAAQQIFERLTHELDEAKKKHAQKPTKRCYLSIGKIIYSPNTNTLSVTAQYSCSRMLDDLASCGYISFDFEQKISHHPDFRALQPPSRVPALLEKIWNCYNTLFAENPEIANDFLKKIWESTLRDSLNDAKRFIKTENLDALEKTILPSTAAQWLFKHDFLDGKPEAQNPLRCAIYRGKTTVVDLIATSFWDSLRKRDKNLTLTYYAQCGQKEKVIQCLEKGAAFKKH